MCRYAEDAAIVMRAIARPDGRDMSVSHVPFNWDGRLDVKKLRVAYVKSFETLSNPVARANALRLLEMLAALGIAELVELDVPDFPSELSGLDVERAASFDEYHRAGRMRKARRRRRPAGRLVPAVEYLQQQRVRMMMMMELARATAGLDAWVVASDKTGADGPSRTPCTNGAAQRHRAMANLAGYPAINVPNGFAETGTPTNATFFGRPFAEMPIVALAKAYQDAAGHHLVRPTRIDELTTDHEQRC
jgi:Asp-tRNA(Asn)/Glu-tRNA(Gln) amidotransferase A subunit family amidase